MRCVARWLAGTDLGAKECKDNKRDSLHDSSLGLTLELSGGGAVRLNEMLDGCDAACSGDNDCRDERTT
jgi:hypothetical protein